MHRQQGVPQANPAEWHAAAKTLARHLSYQSMDEKQRRKVAARRHMAKQHRQPATSAKVIDSYTSWTCLQPLTARGCPSFGSTCPCLCRTRPRSPI